MAKALELHEASEIFPLVEEGLQELADDIKANGMLCPVELFHGKVLDGRRRLRACEIHGIAPATVDVTPSDPVAYVLSLNLHRRHLTPSQRAMVAARSREFYDDAAKERMLKGKKSDPVENLPQGNDKARDAAGKAVGVSGKSVDYATKVLKQGTPELIKAVDEGRMAIHTAAIHASDPPEVQRAVATEPKRNRTYKSNGKAAKEPESEPELEVGQSRGVGVQRAHEAIACLKKIPKKDGLRSRGLQIVADWIKHNK